MNINEPSRGRQGNGVMKLVICDDNAADAAYVSNLAESWGREKGIAAELITFSSAEALLFAWEENRDMDVLLLDIEMGGMSGLELAKRLRQRGARMQIIFLTGYMDYIAEGYDVEALHYLLKPVNRERLSRVLDRAAERISVRESMLLLPLPDGAVQLPLYEIRYLEVMRNYTTVHGNEDYIVKKSLNELAGQLDESFYRIHRSFMVNLRFVRRIAREEVTLKDGTALPLSRKHYEGLNRALIAYF